MVIILIILSSLWLPNHSLPGALSSQVSWLCVKGHQMFSLHLQEQKQDGQKRWTTTNFPWTWHQNLWVTQWDECVCVHAKSLPLCQTLCDPMTVDHQAPLSMGFPSQEHWSELLFPSPGDLPDPGIKSESLKSRALAGKFFTTSTTWEVLTMR